MKIIFLAGNVTNVEMLRSEDVMLWNAENGFFNTNGFYYLFKT